jgi:hypothetical protein
MQAHDRKSTDLPINAVVAPVVVDDPFSNRGEKIEVMRSLRDDPLAGMFSRAQIDDAQYRAGRQWQSFHEQSAIGALGAIDPTKEAVDGGRMRDVLTDKQAKAIMELRRIEPVLGMEGAALVRDVLGARMSIAVAAARRGCMSEAEAKYIGRRFRESLETLAVHWGFAGKPLPPDRRRSIVRHHQK